MIKEYKFDYNSGEAGAVFKVDTSKFTSELAKENLNFFLWDYNKEADPIDEVMKKYATEVIRISSENRGKSHIMKEFENYEGFVILDGSMGIELISVSEYVFCDCDCELIK